MRLVIKLVMKFIIIINLFILLFLYPAIADSQDKKIKEQLTEAQQEQIMLLRTELEFLASKLLKITHKNKYSLHHPGHMLVHFGVCGKGTNEGFKVKCVTPHTAAYQIGIKTGDTLQKINGVKLTNLKPQEAYDRYSEILKQLKDGDSVEVEFQQNGEDKIGKGVIKSILAPGYQFEVSGKIEKKTN